MHTKNDKIYEAVKIAFKQFLHTTIKNQNVTGQSIGLASMSQVAYTNNTCNERPNEMRDA